MSYDDLLDVDISEDGGSTEGGQGLYMLALVREPIPDEEAAEALKQHMVACVLNPEGLRERPEESVNHDKM